jgi:hypothetical protein
MKIGPQIRTTEEAVEIADLCSDRWMIVAYRGVNGRFGCWHYTLPITEIRDFTRSVGDRRISVVQGQMNGSNVCYAKLARGAR